MLYNKSKSRKLLDPQRRKIVSTELTVNLRVLQAHKMKSHQYLKLNLLHSQQVKSNPAF